MLGALINDPKRGWLTEPQSAAEYANGARFFAYRTLRRTLSCRELILASQDLRLAADRLSVPGTAVSAARGGRRAFALDGGRRRVAQRNYRPLLVRITRAPRIGGFPWETVPRGKGHSRLIFAASATSAPQRNTFAMPGPQAAGLSCSRIRRGRCRSDPTNRSCRCRAPGASASGIRGHMVQQMRLPVVMTMVWRLSMLREKKDSATALALITVMETGARGDGKSAVAVRLQRALSTQ